MIRASSLGCVLALLAACSTRIELESADAGLDGGLRVRPADAGRPDGAAPDAAQAAADAGSDAGECLPTETRCGERCVDLAFDVASCGECGFDCAAVPHTLGPVSCAWGRCVYGGCEPGWAFCTGGPSDYCETSVATSERCGACDYACPEAIPICERYEREDGGIGHRCTSVCPVGLALCGEGCTDLDRDEANCGACGEACAQVDHGYYECDFGTCRELRCHPGYHPCEGACLPDDDVASCGTACAPCPARPHRAPTCDGVGCGDGPCEAGYADCDGVIDNGCETAGTCA